MGVFLKQVGSLIAGQMAGSNHKAAFIVKTMRVTYMATGTAIAVTWYSAWRNERVEPGSFKFPFPFANKLERKNPPDRPEKELPLESPAQTASNSFFKGTSSSPGSVSGGYVYPFTSKATVGRIDMGQDFGGTGPIFSPGAAKVTEVGAPGWPGGSGVTLQLLTGNRKGQFIYIREGIQVEVRKGQIVQAGQRVGAFIPFSSTGIEIGFCDEQGQALATSEYKYDGYPTIRGKEMAAWLKELEFHPASLSQSHLQSVQRSVRIPRDTPSIGNLKKLLPNAPKG